MFFDDFPRRFPPVARGLLHSARQGRLEGSYLIYGDDPAWRQAGARFLAALAVCRNPRSDGAPCGECRVCRQIAESSYAELYELSPSGKAGYIRVGDADNPEPNTLRWFEEQFHLSSSADDGRKIGIIHDADAMNDEAQNALLKTLEEPGPGVIFILTTGNPAALLPTTRSRCQLLPVLTNTMRYDFEGHEELAKLLGELLFECGDDLPRAAGIADAMLELAGKLAGDSADRAENLWKNRLEQAEMLEDRSLAKRIAEQRDNAAASWYLKLRKQLLSLIHTFCAQSFLWSVTHNRETLPNPELFDGLDLPEQPDRERLRRALDEADKLLFRLRFQIDEQLAVRAFVLNTACGQD